MSFQFRPAERSQTNLLIGVVGPSGSGKSMSALRLATGLGGKICVIDTEGGRANMYAKDFDFLHAEFNKPFSAERYVQALDASAKEKPNVTILDSVSHIWEGEGGTLEFAEKERERVKNDFAMWAKPKQAHQKFVNALLQMPCHVILCFRAKSKKAMVPGKNGKMEVVDKGWHPIADQSLTYELTLNMLLSTERKGVPIIDGFDFGKLPEPMRDLIKTGEQITEQTGRDLAAWCAGEVQPPQSSRAPNPKEPPQTDGDAETFEVVVQFDETSEADSLESVGRIIAGALGRKDVNYDEACRILTANGGLISDMPAAWQDKLSSMASLKAEKAS